MKLLEQLAAERRGRNCNKPVPRPRFSEVEAWPTGELCKFRT
jgi:hypothetical protein